MSSDILSLATSILTACDTPPERSRRERKEDAFGGPLWHVTLPVSPSLIERIIDYARMQQVSISGVTGRLQSLKGTDAGLIVTVTGDVWDRGVTATATIGYANDAERKLCTGQWLALKHGNVRITRLMPEVVPKDYGAKILIGAEFRRPGILGWIAGGVLSHIELHRDKAVPVLSSPLKTWVAPDIKFAWKAAV